MDNLAVLQQIDFVLARVDVLTSKFRHKDRSDMADEEASEAVSLMTSTIERLVPANNSFHKDATKIRSYTSSIHYSVNPLLGILKALRIAYEMNYLQSVEELIHADMFSDFLEMAEHLLKEGFKDPAAVLCGSTLEEHLRKLSAKNGIAVLRPDGSPKKSNALNDELAAAVYSKLDQKSVTAWLDLRNKAAHGQYSDYTKDQVSLLLQGVRDFIARLPA